MSREAQYDNKANERKCMVYMLRSLANLVELEELDSPEIVISINDEMIGTGLMAAGKNISIQFDNIREKTSQPIFKNAQDL